MQVLQDNASHIMLTNTTPRAQKQFLRIKRGVFIVTDKNTKSTEHFVRVGTGGRQATPAVQRENPDKPRQPTKDKNKIINRYGN